MFHLLAVMTSIVVALIGPGVFLGAKPAFGQILGDQPGDDTDPVRCFDHVWRDAQNAIQAYQIAFADGWSRELSCRTRAPAAAELDPCWSLVMQARPLIEQAAKLYESARRTPEPRGSQLVKQANTMMSQATALVERAGDCFQPVFTRWQQNGGRYVAGDRFDVTTDTPTGGGQPTPPVPPNLPVPPHDTRPLPAPRSPQQDGPKTGKGRWTGIVEHCRGTPGTGSAPGAQIGGPGGITGQVCIHCFWYGSGSERTNKYIVAPDYVLEANKQPRAYERSMAVERACSLTEPNQVATQPKPPTQTPTPVFHYFYINGIHTPLNGNPRGPGVPGGTYEFEYDLVKRNLVSSPAVKIPSIKQIDLMEEPTHNVSGKDRLFSNLVGQWCNDDARARWVGTPAEISVRQRIVCGGPEALDKSRGNTFGTGFAWGDLIECFRQALGVPVLRTIFADKQIEEDLLGIGFTSDLDEVKNIVDIMTRIYRSERSQSSGQRHYFIVVAHSQGNFFAEGVAYRLKNNKDNKADPLGGYIYAHRLAILSLGSPTRYDSLDPEFVAARIQHITRADDGIHVLDGISIDGAISKSPWPRAQDEVALWPWKPRVLDGFFGTGLMGAGKAFQIMKGADPLLIPLMNAHLLDNYMADPTLTPPRYLPPDKLLLPYDVAIALMPYRGGAPAGAPLLNKVRSATRVLKESLLFEENTTSQQIRGR